MRKSVRFILAALLLLSPAAVRAQAGEADAAAIRQVIELQIDAFRRDDGPAAYGFATRTIQEKFGNPQIFLEMVRTGYAPVYRPRTVEFRELEVSEGRLIQKVFVIGPDGQPAMALYEMQQQPDGSWRINGCWLTKADDQSV